MKEIKDFNYWLLENKSGLDLAEDPNTDPAILDRFVKHPLSDVRYAAAMNSSTSLETLEKFAMDSNGGVRRAVALNPNASKDILNILSKDSSIFVRGNVIYNPNVTSEILRKLAEDPDHHVSSAASSNLKKIIRKENEAEMRSWGWDDAAIERIRMLGIE